MAQGLGAPREAYCVLDSEERDYLVGVVGAGPGFDTILEIVAGEEFREFLPPMAREGLKKRLAKMPDADPKKYWDRLELELGVIKQMGFPGYFLIVQDFINWAKDHDIPVGPGRGSAAGSLVAYSLRITNLDPLPYDLFFERFLNIERVSMDSSGIGFLVSINTRMRSSGRSFYLYRLSPAVEKTLGLVQLLNFFEILKDESALAALGG